jgi:hypothetical protein
LAGQLSPAERDCLLGLGADGPIYRARDGWRRVGTAQRYGLAVVGRLVSARLVEPTACSRLNLQLSELGRAVLAREISG